MAPSSGGQQGSTLFIVQVELPAFNLLSQVKFNVRASRYEELHEGAIEMLQDFAESNEDCLDSLDVNGSKYGLERMRKHACIAMEELQTQVKMVEEWKQKVDRAATQMNKMRDAYFKELFHLREQVYQKKKADEKSEHFQPSYAIHFDPAEYTMEDEVAQLVSAKAEFIKQEFDTKLAETETKHFAKIKMLNNQLMTANMKLSRKEVLLDKVMHQHGYEDEDHVQEELGVVKVHKDKIQSKINRQCEKAEQKAVYDFRKQSASAGEQSVEESKGQAQQHFRQFLERRFGTLKEAKAHLGTLRSLDQSLGLVEFKALCDQLGYAASDPKQTFKEVSAGQPFTTIELILENIQRADVPACNRGNVRRATAPCKLGEDMLVAIAESGEWDESEKAQEDEDKASVVSEGLVSNSSKGSGGSSSSKASKGSRMSKGSRTSSFTKAIGVAVAVKKASAKLSRARACPTGQAVRKRTLEVMTELSVDAGTEAAWAEEAGSVLCFTRLCPADRLRDQGTDARPYEEAFKRKHLRSRAVQSQIDGRMLDKAMEFYDKVAERNWNDLAGIMYESEASQTDPVEDCKPRPLHGNLTGEAPLYELSDENRQGFSHGRPTETMTITDMGFHETLVRRGVSESQPRRRCTFPFEDGPEKQTLEKVVEDLSTVRSEEFAELIAVGTEQVGGSSSSRASSPRCFKMEGSTRLSQTQVPACSTAECGVQCLLPCLGQLESPDEDEPPEASLERMQRALDLAQELRAGLPAMKLRAEKMASEAGPLSEKRQRLLEQMRMLEDKLEGRPALSQTCRALDAEAEAMGGVAKAAEPNVSIETLLSRHGLDASSKDQQHPQPREPSFMEHRRISGGPETISRKDTRHRTTFFRRPAESRPLRSPRAPGASAQGELVFSPMGVESIVPADEADDDIQGLRRSRAITARKMSAVDTTKMITDRARRHSTEGQPQAADAEAPAPVQQSEDHLSPGWSGLVPPSCLLSRGPSEEVEALNAPKNRSPNPSRGQTQAGALQGEQEPCIKRAGKRLNTTALCFVGPLASACAAASAAVPEDPPDLSPEPSAQSVTAPSVAAQSQQVPRRHSCESYFTPSLPPVAAAASGGGREAMAVVSPPPFQRHSRRVSSVRFKPMEDDKRTEEGQDASMPAPGSDLPERLAPKELAARREGPGRSHANKLEHLSMPADDGYLDTDIVEVMDGNGQQNTSSTFSGVPSPGPVSRELSSSCGSSQTSHSARASAFAAASTTAAGTETSEPGQRVERSSTRSATIASGYSITFPGGAGHALSVIPRSEGSARPKVGAQSPVRKSTVAQSVSPTRSSSKPSRASTKEKVGEQAASASQAMASAGGGTMKERQGSFAVAEPKERTSYGPKLPPPSRVPRTAR